MSHDTQHQINARYLEAAEYAFQVLDANALPRFARLQELSLVATLPELKLVVEGWAKQREVQTKRTRKKLPKKFLGDSTCSQCGVPYHKADSVEKCPACALAESLDIKATEQAELLHQVASLVAEWYRLYADLIFSRIHKAFRLRGMGYDPALAEELSAMCWARIAAKAGMYDDEGHKVSTWLATVSDNVIKDYFRVTLNREKWPMSSIEARPDGGENIPDPRYEQPPAKPTRPTGTSGDNDDAAVSDYDRKIGKQWSA